MKTEIPNLEEVLTLQRQIADIILKRNSTLSVAESCTGGMISHIITSISGASAYYLGGVCSYAIAVKEKVLGLDPDTIKTKGVVSSEVAEGMAEGVKNLMGSTFSLATTGLAGPGGDEFNPEGTVWIAVSGPKGTISRKRIMQGDRAQNILSFTHEALLLLYAYLKDTIEVQTTGQS
ncbi:MAG: CinA family protein [Candidatus Cryptobacteroides sp.]